MENFLSVDNLILWARPVGTALGVWLIGWLFTRFVLPRIVHAALKSQTRIDDILIETIRPHIPLWFLALGITIAIRQTGAEVGTTATVDQIIQAGVILSITVAAAAFIARLISARALPFLSDVPSTGLIQGTVQFVVIALGVLMILTNLGVAITPMLTALGIGSLAVALALQPTLTNLFAGFYITLAGQIRVGDYVALESGQTGFVVDVGWRTMTIRELPNNLIVVPNAKVSEMIVTNYSLPESEQSVVIQVGVSYGSDLAKVERVTIEVAREVQGTVEGAIPTHEPFTRYHTFGESSINFSVILRVKTFVDRYLMTHEFVKRLHERYEKEGIEIPFPQRVLHFEGGKPIEIANIDASPKN
jgi:small-conductance mechanosensitive channel